MSHILTEADDEQVAVLRRYDDNPTYTARQLTRLANGVQRLDGDVTVAVSVRDAAMGLDEYLTALESVSDVSEQDQTASVLLTTAHVPPAVLQGIAAAGYAVDDIERQGDHIEVIATEADDD